MAHAWVILVIVGVILASAAAGELGGAGASGVRDEISVEYVVRVDSPQTQMADVAMLLRGVVGQTVDVMLPAWRPGRYQILDLAGGVRQVSAEGFDEGGRNARALAVEAIDKSTWRVSTDGTREIRVSYRVYCNSIGDRTRHIDDTHAFLSPAAVFMYSPAFRDSPLRLRLEGPSHWDVATGLEPWRDGGDDRVLAAANYDVLVDSPIEWGVHERIRFAVDGVPHEIAIWEGSRRVAKFDAERLKEDFSTIVREQKRVFGHLPYTRYVYLIHCYIGGGGGTEHLNSTIMGCSPAAFDSTEAYRRFLGLVSHEMFHTWNVKQLRPAGIHPYDYQRENYTRLLWMAEGTTSYYDDLTLARTGLFKVDEYLNGLRDLIDAQQKRPGDGVQSVEASSFEAWIKFNKPTPDDANSTVSFYDKGALVNLALDLDLRARTDGERSLDDVMRDLYQRFPLSGAGFQTIDVLEALGRASGHDHREFYARHIAGTEAIDWNGYLRPIGLELVDEPEKPGKDSDKELVPAREKLWLGFALTTRDGAISVSTVSMSGPAYRAGILPGDQLVAVDGVRIRDADLSGHLKRVNAGDHVRLTVFRYDVMREFEVAAVPEPKKPTLRRVKEPNGKQKQLYQGWLKQTWPEK
jgi:predicted metalloprotease with PDZ domain